MKKINIFFGSSILNHKREIDDINDFIMTCNKNFERKYEVSIISEIASIEFDKIILNCEICMFVFFESVSEKTKKEIDFAYNLMKNSAHKKPKIYIYFKNANDTQNLCDEIVDFMSIVDKTYKHFYSSFSSIDTIKLKILLNVKLSCMNYLNIDFDGNELIIDDYKCPIDLKCIDEFKNNNDFKRLNDEYLEINQSYYDLKKKINGNSISLELKNEYIYVCQKRKKIYDDIQLLNKNIFDVIYGIIYEETFGYITDRMREAIKLVECGDLEAAIKILSNSTIDKEYEKIEEDQKKAATNYVKEHYLAITILKTLIGYKDRFKEIDERYSKIIKVILNFKVEYDVLAMYAIYLKERNCNDDAIKYFEKYIENGDNRLIANNCIHSLYEIYLEKGNLDKALEKERQIYEDLNELKEKSIISSAEYDYCLRYIHISFASTLSRITNRQGNIWALTILIEEYKRTTDKLEKLKYLNYIVSNYYRLNEFEHFDNTILLIIEELKSISEEEIKNRKVTIANCYMYIAMYYDRNKNIELARKYYELAFALSKELYIDDPIGYLNHYLDNCLHLAEFYLTNNIFVEKTIELINFSIEKYENIYRNDIIIEDHLTRAYMLKYNFGIKTKQFEVSLKAVERFDNYYESIYTTSEGFDIDFYDDIKIIITMYNQMEQYSISLQRINYVLDKISRSKMDNELFEKYIEMNNYLLGTFYAMKKYDTFERISISLLKTLKNAVKKDNYWANELINSCKKFGIILFRLNKYKKSELVFLKLVDYYEEHIIPSSIHCEQSILEGYEYLERIYNECDKDKLELIWEQKCPCLSHKKYKYCHSKLFCNVGR